MLGKEGELGCLREKALADLVVFDVRRPHFTPLLDPLGTLVHDGCGRDVEQFIGDLAGVIAADPGLTMVLLRAANSAQSASRRRIEHARDAVDVLKLKRGQPALAVIKATEVMIGLESA